MTSYSKVSRRLENQITNAVAGAWLELKEKHCPETFTDLPPEGWSAETKRTMALLDEYSSLAVRRIKTVLVK
jgi:hypothetical protein